jgi:hypothetical protein
MLSLQHDAVVAAHGRLRDKKLVKREAVKAKRTGRQPFSRIHKTMKFEM